MLRVTREDRIEIASRLGPAPGAQVNDGAGGHGDRMSGFLLERAVAIAKRLIQLDIGLGTEEAALGKRGDLTGIPAELRISQGDRFAVAPGTQEQEGVAARRRASVG